VRAAPRQDGDAAVTVVTAQARSRRGRSTGDA